MDWVETTGRSVEEAKDAALDQLGVDETDAEFVVVSEPRTGLFGRMRGEARVRARVRPTSPPPKRGRSRRAPQQAGSSTRGRSSGEKVNARSSGVSVAEREGPESRRGEDERRDGTSPGKAAGAAAGSRKRRRSRGGRGRGGARASQAAAQSDGAGRAAARANGREKGEGAPGRAKQPAQAGAAKAVMKEEVVGEELSLEEQGESAREFLEGLVELLGLGATVRRETLDAETVQVSVDGEELGVLIGPGGGTLSALQELARTVVQRRTGGRTERILVDVAGYRARRAAALQRFTREVAEGVLSSGKERALEPMSPADRKVVHDTINEIEGVGTRSVGEEPRRYIIVAPARQEAAEVQHG